METTTTTPAPLAAGDRIQIVKGCTAREVHKYTNAKIIGVRELGADYSHAVRVELQFTSGFGAGRVIYFYARHKNRLSDAIVSLNDGNPLHRIQVRRKA